MKSCVASSLGGSSRALSRRAFTRLELLVSVALVAIVTVVGFIGYGSMVPRTYDGFAIQNVRALANASISWSADNGGRLPSPKYPGDYRGDEYPVAGVSPAESIPKYWNLTESGLWLDGVVYARIYIEDEDESKEAQKLAELAPSAFSSSRATDGGHLVGTVFESSASVKIFPSETNWYRHSYAMNANLQFDDEFTEINDGEEPWLTEKSLDNLTHFSAAMLFIDCLEKNVVMAEDIELIRESAERHGGNKLIVCHVDGSVVVMKPRDIPDGNPETNLEASKFWRGVDPE